MTSLTPSACVFRSRPTLLGRDRPGNNLNPRRDALEPLLCFEHMFDMAELNQQQRAAVGHAGGHLLVVAGAGTGKTKTLAARVAYLIDSGVDPGRIMLLTFTRRAAAEMLRRVAAYTSRQSAARVWGGTFHSVAHRFLRVQSRSVGLPDRFTVMDQSDVADLLNLVRNELRLAENGTRFPKKDTLAAIYSRAVNSETKLSAVLDEVFPWCARDGAGIADIFRGYTERKQSQGLVDFDDLLLMFDGLLEVRGNPITGAFDHVLVDEYQDTNAVQARILRSLGSNAKVTAVGDDAQAIYSFRAATVRNILDFPAHFPGATVVRLEENYRSTQPVLDASNAVLAAARVGYNKSLWTRKRGGEVPALKTCLDEPDQSDSVCRSVLDLRERGVSLREQAVLFRAVHHSAHLEIELGRRRIPFVKYGGLRFVEAAHIKDLLAGLRIAENQFDELSWFRVLQLVDGVGPTIAARIMSAIGVRTPGPMISPIAALGAGLDVPPRSRAELEDLASALAECASGDLTPALEVARISAWYEPMMERVYDNAASRRADLEQLQRIASSYSARGRFLVELTLDPPAATGDLAGPPGLDDDYLVLSTIHSAKGCEWDAVHVIHAVDGMIPSDMALRSDDELEEERRLLYVAMTRARSMVCVYWPLRYYHRRLGMDDAHNYAQLSRFLTSAEVGRCFVRSGPSESDDRQVVPSGSATVAAITSRLEELWS